MSGYAALEVLMQYVKLGRSGLDVSPVAIGCMGFGDPGHGYPSWSIDEEASRVLIRHAIDAGINFFDTANLYSNGQSEEILGRAVRDFIRRDAVVIATKLSAPTRNGPNAIGLSRKTILAEVDHSLRRLGVDHIDLLQIHRRDQTTPWEETLEALHEVVRAGKARYLGASSMKAWEFAKALHLQRSNGWARFIVMQHNYSLLAREEELEMIPLCADEGVQTVIYSPLARGRLARPWGQETARAHDEAAYATMHEATADSDRKIVAVVGEIAEERDTSMAAVAYAWLRRHPVVAAPLVGALKTSHIDDAVAALSLTLTDEEAARLEADYTPRRDSQGVSEPAMLAHASEIATGFTASLVARP
jgi:aryl-alcohol dehydrogenase-like predicted oxidoreductase